MYAFKHEYMLSMRSMLGMISKPRSDYRVLIVCNRGESSFLLIVKPVYGISINILKASWTKDSIKLVLFLDLHD